MCVKDMLFKIPNIKRILQTVWHQISHADEVFVIGALQEDGTVRGGTGWGAELARLWSKPVLVFDRSGSVVAWPFQLPSLVSECTTLACGSVRPVFSPRATGTSTTPLL